MKSKLIIILIVLSLFVIVFWAGFKYLEPKSSRNKMVVTTSFYPLYYLASQIVGEKAEVVNITPSGAEPHDYEPSPQDIITIEQSKLLILNGGQLETWGNRIEDQLNGSNTQVLVVGDDIFTKSFINKDGETSLDPHIWLDPKLLKAEAVKINKSLSDIDSANKDYYQGNLNILTAKLDSLDQDYKKGLELCESKNFVTSHAAFGYLANAYDLKQVSITGLSPDAEPSPSQLADIAKFAKDNNVKYIFFESLVSPKLSETVASEIGAKTLVLNPIEGITPEEKSSGKDFISIMKDNLNNLRLALDCK